MPQHLIVLPNTVSHWSGTMSSLKFSVYICVRVCPAKDLGQLPYSLWQTKQVLTSRGPYRGPGWPCVATCITSISSAARRGGGGGGHG